MANGWNYPPGVTGHEDVFGPNEEREETDNRTCPDCGELNKVVVTTEYFTFNIEERWTCPGCGEEHAEDITDDLREAHEERLAEEREDFYRYGF